jgi:predicted nucleic acid-binding protein
LRLIRLDDDLLDTAAHLDTPALRSLDAIHLASALALGKGLAAVVSYDRRMAAAAERLGLTVVAPGAS